MRPLLAANEQISQQGYGYSEPISVNGELGPGKKAVYVALTNQRLFLGNLAQTAGCINALDVGDVHADWVVRLVNYSPPSPLQGEARSTTMETLLDQYRKSRGV